MIYFIQCGSGRGPVKIGFGGTRRDCERRLQILQTGNHERLFLIAVMGGDLKREAVLHERFAEGHIRGEWFRWDTPGLDELISDALHEQTLIDSGGRYCEQCGTTVVKPPRRKLCSAQCERDKKVTTARVWKRLNPRVPLVALAGEGGKPPDLQD